MKKLIAIAAGLGLLATIASAQVTTRNAAGYAKVTISAPGLALLSTPFDRFDANPDHNLDELVPGFPAGTQVFRYDFNGQTYLASNFQSAFGIGQWVPDIPIKRGEAFFLSIPAPDAFNPATSYDWYAHGQVPDTTTAPTTALALGAGKNSMVGFPYPVARNILNTKMGDGAQAGDQLYIWDQSSSDSPVGGWIAYNFSSAFGITNWNGSDGSTNPTFVPGTGFVFTQLAANSRSAWTETKTDYYNWP